MNNSNYPTILFVLVNHINSAGPYGGSKSGLLNSATMTANQVHDYLHYNTVVVVVQDSNQVWKEIVKYKPDVCILEAIWVGPAKMQNLVELYPDVIFITRVHSEIPFLANEGYAISWIKGLIAIKNSYVAFNSLATERQFFALGYKPYYLPNIYSDVNDVIPQPSDKQDHILDVGCFGSIRPMKNQLFQAMTAALYCNLHHLKLRFHINASRVEQQGGSALNNIRAFFEGTDHELVEHGWLERDEFLKLVSTMDIGMQLSFNETFNIVSADFIFEGIPIVVSPTISWMPKESRAQFDSMEDIMAKMQYCLQRPVKVANDNILALDKHNLDSIKSWKKVLRSLT